MKLCIRNGRVISRENKELRSLDILISGGIIRSVREPGGEYPDYSCIDAEGKWVMPGFIDLHVHLREPGQQYKEDIISGSKAAARGGFTTICCMPNTDPPVDTPELVMNIDKRGEKTGLNLLVIAAITQGQKGHQLAPWEEMIRLKTRYSKFTGKGICAVSEDGKSVADSSLMLEAMKKAKELDVPVFDHCEDSSLTRGVMNLGNRSIALGLDGIPKEAEEIIVARDILLAKNVGCRLHLCHISTKTGVELIRFGKKSGISLTAETAPHYFTLTEEDVQPKNGMFKMNPPLRTKEDVEAIREALADGTLDVIATDHAPHAMREKMCHFNDSAFGVAGLETAFAVSYTALVRTGILSPLELVEKISKVPADILGIDRGMIAPGKAADIAIADVESKYRIDSDAFASKGKNTPFEGRLVYGKITHTLVDGKLIYEDKE